MGRKQRRERDSGTPVFPPSTKIGCILIFCKKQLGTSQTKGQAPWEMYERFRIPRQKLKCVVHSNPPYKMSDFFFKKHENNPCKPNLSPLRGSLTSTFLSKSLDHRPVDYKKKMTTVNKLWVNKLLASHSQFFPCSRNVWNSIHKLHNFYTNDLILTIFRGVWLVVAWLQVTTIQDTTKFSIS